MKDCVMSNTPKPIHDYQTDKITTNQLIRKLSSYFKGERLYEMVNEQRMIVDLPQLSDDMIDWHSNNHVTPGVRNEMLDDLQENVASLEEVEIKGIGHKAMTTKRWGT